MTQQLVFRRSLLREYENAVEQLAIHRAEVGRLEAIVAEKRKAILLSQIDEQGGCALT